MAVTRASLRRFIGTPLGDSEQDALLDELLAAAEAAVTRYAPDAPDSAAHAAVRNMSAFLWHNRGVDGQGRIRRFNAFVDSGARALVAPYRVPVAVAAGGAS